MKTERWIALVKVRTRSIAEVAPTEAHIFDDFIEAVRYQKEVDPGGLVYREVDHRVPPHLRKK